MFIIDSSIETPDSEYLYERQRELLEEGIAVKELSELERDFTHAYNKARKRLQDEYGIENPNSSQQVLAFFDKCLSRDVYSVLQNLSVDLTLYKSEMMNIVYKLHINGVKPDELHYITVAASVEYTEEEKLMENVEVVMEFVRIMLDNDIITCMLKDGKWTTNKEAMAMLALKGHQSAVDIMTYRKAKNYAETVTKFKGAVAGDGRVHPKMSIGKTNRIEYSNPALMNIPKQLLWDIIGPRTEGNMLVSVDIKNQEPWIMINMLGIERLRALAEADGDLYESVFEDIFGKIPEPIERKELKQAWNAMSYGATKYGVRAICRNIDGDAVYDYFSKIKEFKQYKAEKTRLAKAGVQLAETYFGTELEANEYGSKLKRVLMDIPIQGTGSDILALLVSHFDEEMSDRGLTDKILLYFTRKDELVIEVDRAYVDEVGKDKVFEILADVFEHRIDDWAPFKVKISEVGVEEEDDLFVED